MENKYKWLDSNTYDRLISILTTRIPIRYYILIINEKD